MRTERGRRACLATALALLVLTLSAETCHNTTSASTSGGSTITISDRFNDVNVVAGTAQSVTAACQAGEVMVGGGYAVTTPAYRDSLDQSLPLDRYFVYADFPSSTTSWTASVLNRAAGTEAGSILLISHVECAAGLSGPPTITHAAGPIRALVTASCAGGGLAGGGYRVTDIRSAKDVIAMVASYGVTGNGTSSSWNVKTVYAQGSSADSLQTQVLAYAVCSTLTTTLGAPTQVTVPAGATDQAIPRTGSASCGAGQLLTGAGFELDPLTDSLPVTSFAADYTDVPTRWTMTLYSLPAPSIDGPWVDLGGTAKLIPICAITQ